MSSTLPVWTFLCVLDIEVSHLQNYRELRFAGVDFLCILDIEVYHLQHNREIHSSNVQKP